MAGPLSVTLCIIPLTLEDFNAVTSSFTQWPIHVQAGTSSNKQTLYLLYEYTLAIEGELPRETHSALDIKDAQDRLCSDSYLAA